MNDAWETVTRMALSCLFGIGIGTALTEYSQHESPKPAVTSQTYVAGQTIAIQYGYSHHLFVVEQVCDGGYLLKSTDSELRRGMTDEQLAESLPFLVKDKE